MQDTEIIGLFFKRDERAIKEATDKYDRYLMKIALNILCDYEESRECVNDTYYKAWSSIPPHKPPELSHYFGKIARETAIDAYRKKHSEKRKSSMYAVALSEIDECIPDVRTTEDAAEGERLSRCLDEFLSALPEESRNIFICRYYYFDSIRSIASYYSVSESKVKSTLYRLRRKLKKYLEEENFSI